MNNLLPRKVKYHQKFDLKGSTYKRQASARERQKQVPTLKDLDFMQIYPEGLFLEPETYDLLIRTIRRDCTVLESFKIMDYSLLIGIHNLDVAQRDDEPRNDNGKIGDNTIKPEESMSHASRAQSISPTPSLSGSRLSPRGSLFRNSKSAVGQDKDSVAKQRPGRRKCFEYRFSKFDFAFKFRSLLVWVLITLLLWLKRFLNSISTIYAFAVFLDSRPELVIEGTDLSMSVKLRYGSYYN